MRANKYGKQRELMRDLYAMHAGNHEKICKEYAQADREGMVPHKSNRNQVSPEKYAISLLYDGIKRGWVNKTSQPINNAHKLAQDLYANLLSPQ